MKKKTGPRMKNEPELMGAKEASEALGVRQPNLRIIRGLPEPYDVVAASTLWRADEIRAFAAERGERLADEAQERLARKKKKEPAAS